MVEGKTRTGFAFTADPEAISDAEFLELLYEVQHDDQLGVFKLIEKLLGKEEKKALYDHVRDEKGRVPTAKLTEEFSDIMVALQEDGRTKNS